VPVANAGVEAGKVSNRSSGIAQKLIVDFHQPDF
jgi:hypothetical protein